MEKIFNNQAELAKRLNSKTGKFNILVPDFYKASDGSYIVKDELLEINTLAGFNRYLEKHQEIIEFLGSEYPKLVSTVYRNTMTSFTDPYKRTTLAKLLAGQPVKNTSIYQEANATDMRSIFSGFLKTYNAKKLGLVGEDVPLPQVKRTKKQALKLFMEEKQGYMIPEIDKDGLVVKATSSKDDFGVRFITVPACDITYDQLFDYLTMPFGDRAYESDIDFEYIHNLCFNAYKNIGQIEMSDSIGEIVDYCMAHYPLSFSRIKPDKEPAPKKPPVEEIEEPQNNAQPIQSQVFFVMVEKKEVFILVDDSVSGKKVEYLDSSQYAEYQKYLDEVSGVEGFNQLEENNLDEELGDNSESVDSGSNYGNPLEAYTPDDETIAEQHSYLNYFGDSQYIYDESLEESSSEEELKHPEEGGSEEPKAEKKYKVVFEKVWDMIPSSKIKDGNGDHADYSRLRTARYVKKLVEIDPEAPEK